MVEQKKVGNEILQLRAKYQIYILKIVLLLPVHKHYCNLYS